MNSTEAQLDVIIPVYQPGQEFLQLIRRLHEQEYGVNRIIIMNTEQKYFDRLVYGTDFFKRYPKVSVYHISRKEFDHGYTRHLGVQKSEAPFFLMMTQDALPQDSKLTMQLLEAVKQEGVAVAYARQLPRKECRELERYTRSFNYPEASCIKTKKDVEKLGIKTYFCSNVCAVYNRKIYDTLGGFVHRTIFNEDMIYAAKAVGNGYGIAYCAKACVIHSHNYTGKEQFKRNFDLGVSQADHPEVFASVASESEGIRMIQKTAVHLKQIGKRRKIWGLLYMSGCKYLGYRMGKMYRKLPRALILHCTMNQNYWSRYFTEA